MLLSHNRLKELVRTGVITNVEDKQINSASIDITLGKTLLLLDSAHNGKVLDYRARDKPEYVSVGIAGESGFDMKSGDRLLASSQQVFNLPPNISAEYKLKSSMARIFLEHLNAGWCDAGWNGSVLTLELINLNPYYGIKLREGDAIGQMVFFEHEPVPSDRSYASVGRYNGDKQVTGIKE